MVKKKNEKRADKIKPKIFWIKSFLVSLLLLVISVYAAPYVMEPQFISWVIHDDLWGEEIIIWNKTIRANIFLKNSWLVPITSGNQEIESEVRSFLRIYIENETGETIFEETKGFNETVLPGDDWLTPTVIDFILPNDLQKGTLNIETNCETVIRVRRCNSHIKKIVHRFEVKDTAWWKVLGIDATKRGVDDLGFFRDDLIYNFWITDTTSIYKTIPAWIEFPAFHRDLRENWWGIILFYNPARGHQWLSHTTQKIQSMLEARYHLPVLLKEYEKNNFSFYTDRFSECKPYNCVTNTLSFKDLRSGIEWDENLFSKLIFQENPDLDFMFMLPYNNQK